MRAFVMVCIVRMQMFFFALFSFDTLCYRRVYFSCSNGVSRDASYDQNVAIYLLIPE